MENTKTVKIEINNAVVNFVRKIKTKTGEDFIAFVVSKLAYNKDKMEQPRYNVFRCTIFHPSENAYGLKNGDIINLEGSFDTSIYNNEIQLKVIVNNFVKMKSANDEQEELPNDNTNAIPANDLPF